MDIKKEDLEIGFEITMEISDMFCLCWLPETVCQFQRHISDDLVICESEEIYDICIGDFTDLTKPSKINYDY